MPIPTADGDVLRYDPPTLTSHSPRIYYVNGIRTSAAVHAKTAAMMAMITQRPVYGVYNLSQLGGVVDFGQCVADWISNTGMKLTELTAVGANKLANMAQSGWHDIKSFFGSKDAPPVTKNHLAGKLSLVPEKARIAFIEGRLALYNKATLALYRQLRTHRNEPQYIIAHSQGNLITSDALWAMVFSYGESSLANMQVYSLASPSPAWPLGIRGRRKLYGFKNDLVTLFDPHNWTVLTLWFAGGHLNRTAGDWRRFGSTPFKRKLPGIDPHDIDRNAFLLNFANSIRRTLGLPPIDLPADRLKELSSVAR